MKNEPAKQKRRAAYGLGHRGETDETIDRTRQFILSLDLDFIQIAPIFILPGSPSYQAYVEQTDDEFWRTNTLQPKHLRELPLPDCTLTTEQLKSHALKIYREFYFRPRQVLRGLKRLRNIDDLSRAVRTSRTLLPTGVA